MYEQIKKELFEKIYINGTYNGVRWKKNVELYKKILEMKYGDIEDFHVKIWGLINGIEEHPKCYCGNKLSLKSIKSGFTQRYCSISCANLSVEYKEKRKAKCLEKYGVEHHLSAKEIKEKKKKTNLVKYGVECALLSEEVKMKVKRTTIQKYGIEHHLATKETKEKIKNTFLKRYNGHPRANVVIKEKVKSNHFKNFGVENPFQRTDVIEKIHNVKNEKYKREILPLRLKCMESFEIFPYQWQVNDYQGAEKEYLFFHKSCKSIYRGQFYCGRFTLCPHCFGNKSQIEHLLGKKIADNFANVRFCDRKLIAPYEIDIIVNDILGIEVNGIYWHRDEAGKISLLTKSEKSPIPLLHFWDYELIYKFDICLSLIYAKLNKFDSEVLAKKCKIVNLTEHQAELFFNENHLLGNVSANYYIGLMYNGDIVQAISIRNLSDNNLSDIEICRFASKLNTKIHDGVEELFKKINYDFRGRKIIGYADKRYSRGNMFRKLEFTELSDSKPKCYWAKGIKNILTQNDYQGADGFYKFSDCGNKIFIKSL